MVLDNVLLRLLHQLWWLIYITTLVRGWVLPENTQVLICLQRMLKLIVNNLLLHWKVIWVLTVSVMGFVLQLVLIVLVLFSFSSIRIRSKLRKSNIFLLHILNSIWLLKFMHLCILRVKLLIVLSLIRIILVYIKGSLLNLVHGLWLVLLSALP